MNLGGLAQRGRERFPVNRRLINMDGSFLSNSSCRQALGGT